MVQLIENILAYPKALGFIRKHNLSRYFIFSGLISLALGLLIFGSAYYASDDVAARLMNFYPFETGRSILEKVSTVFSALLILALGLVLYKNVLLVLTGPLLGPLSERVESIENGGTANPSISLGYSIARGVKISIRNLAKELFYTLLILLLGLIPFLTPFTTFLIFALQAYYVGCGNIDFHLEKRYGVNESVAFCRKRRWAMIGNGAGFLLLLFIPLVGLLIAPVLGAVAATRYGIRQDTMV